MTLWLNRPSLGMTATLSPAVSPRTPVPVRSWGQCGTTYNRPDLVIHRLIHSPQPLLSLLEDHYFLKREGKSPQ